MTAVRWTGATLCLFGGALFALLCWNMETCTGGAADSLLVGPIIALPLFVLGWMLFPNRGSSPVVIIFVAAVPAIITAFISAWTARLAIGRSACNVLTGLPFEKDGREIEFLALWAATCLIFWIGLVVSVRVAARNGKPSIESA